MSVYTPPNVSGQGSWQGPGTGIVSAASYPPCTMTPAVQSGASATPGATWNIFHRSMGSGSVSTISLLVAAQSGNIAVGLYRSPGGTSTALTRIASSGLIPCPAGMANIPISPAPVQVDQNCYFALFADNTSATFFCQGSGWASYPLPCFASGLAMGDNSSPAMPLTPNLTAGLRGICILMTGLP